MLPHHLVHHVGQVGEDEDCEEDHGELGGSLLGSGHVGPPLTVPWDVHSQHSNTLGDISFDLSDYGFRIKCTFRYLVLMIESLIFPLSGYSIEIIYYLIIFLFKSLRVLVYYIVVLHS